ncbi:MAG TPA: MarR family transcriptional regulator [Gaiellales bacterium]|nr:MarR family transcriptional regulator [Gaiellales bacterium]
MATPESSQEQVWAMLFELVLDVRTRLPAVAAAVNLSPMQLQLLRLLEPRRPVPMGRLAEHLGCNASNITGIVDRLEARGLIRREPSLEDRRVRAVAITVDGSRIRRLIVRRLGEPPERIRRLSAEDRRELCRILGGGEA